MEKVTTRLLGDENKRLEKATRTAAMIGDLQKAQLQRAREAKENGRTIAWCMVGVQPEIIRGFDIADLYPENFAAVASAKRQALPYIQLAESRGFPGFLCSYARYGLGYAERMAELDGRVPPSPEEVPWGGLVKPDIILGRGQCEPGYKWFQAVGERFERPVFVHEQKALRLAPNCNPILPYKDPVFREELIKAEMRDNRNLVNWIAGRTGKKIDWDRVIEAFHLHNEMRRLWHGVFELRKSIPSPMPSEDMVGSIYPGYSLAGTKEAVDFYRQLHDEVEERARGRLCVIPELKQEKYRLFWGGIGLWHYTAFYQFVQMYGAVFAVENQYYRDAFVETETAPEKDPLRAIAERHYHDTRLAAERAVRYGAPDLRMGMVLELLEQYRCDGAVLHFLTSCRPITIGWTNTARVITERTGIPVLFLESDMCDPRSISPAEARNKAEAFLEIVEQRRPG